jgi:hypothetical protein
MVDAAGITAFQSADSVLITLQLISVGKERFTWKMLFEPCSSIQTSNRTGCFSQTEMWLHELMSHHIPLQT